MVADPSKTWLGLEHFCNESDPLWSKSDAEIIALAKSEMAALKMVDGSDVSDAIVIRMPKTYPVYFGSYGRFNEVAQWINRFHNLFLIGRNGMHHSMLTAMTAVDNMVANIRGRDNLWALNTEFEYHEEK